MTTTAQVKTSDALGYVGGTEFWLRLVYIWRHAPIAMGVSDGSLISADVVEQSTATLHQRLGSVGVTKRVFST